MKTILVTGGAGFIGSNFVPYFLEANQDVHVVNLDLLTYAGNLDNLSELEGHPRYTFVQGDIADHKTVRELFEKHQFQGVIHFAAESHVDNSISGPAAFVRTNVNGTFELIEAARQLWLEAPGKVKPEFKDARFLHVSTDEVYGQLGETGFFTEETPYAPSSPYSASKASSDLLVRSYFHTYGLNVVITNCSNNYGPKQHNEKLIPVVIRKALAGEPIPIYGTGKNVRDWLYVIDHCRAVIAAFEKGRSGETYNVGGDNERRNLELAEHICKALDQLRPKQTGSYSDQITFVQDRAGHDFRYAIDATKLKTQLGWQPKTSFSEGLAKTIDFYISKYK